MANGQSELNLWFEETAAWDIILLIMVASLWFLFIRQVNSPRVQHRPRVQIHLVVWANPEAWSEITVRPHLVCDRMVESGRS